MSIAGPRLFRRAGPLLVAFDVVVLFAIFASVVVLRWTSILAVHALNPDEAQMGANALRILRHGAGWLSSDGTTSGPLNSLPLLLPAIFGVEPSLVTGRFVAALLVAVSLFLVYATARLWLGRPLALLVTAPAVGAFALVDGADFTHYSSELLPVAMILLAAHLLVRLLHRPLGVVVAAVLLGGIAVIAGALPFAKIQTAPIAIALALAAVAYVVAVGRARLKVFAPVVIVGGIATAVALVVPLAIAGHLSSFTTGYIGLARAYVGTPLDGTTILGMVQVDEWISTLFLWLVVTTVLTLVGFVVAGRTAPLTVGEKLTLAMLGVILATSVLAASLPGRGFAHYINLVWAPAVLLLAFVLSRLSLVKVRRWGPIATAVVLGVVILLVLPTESLTTLKDRLHLLRVNAAAMQPDRGDLFSVFTTEEHAESLVWGWMPEWYLASGTYPAAHETMNEFQIRDTPNREFFRDRLLDDLDEAEAAFVVDAVVPGSFGFEDNSADGVGSFRELATIVNEGYRKVSGGGSDCPRTYLRADLFDEFDARYVEPRSVSGMAGLFDRQLFQTGCGDSWSPDSSEDVAEVGFDPADVDSVWILGARPDHGVAWEADARLILFRDGEQVTDRTVDVNAWPRWTRVPLDGVEADGLTLSVESATGGQSTINELVILRR